MLPKGLTPGELAFCRSVAVRGVPIVAFQRAWPRMARAFLWTTVTSRTEALMASPDIIAGIDHYRERYDGAKARLRWNKQKRYQDRVKLEDRLGIGVRDLGNVLDHGTPETRDKNRTNIINKLYADGKGSLTYEMVTAAREIAALIEARQRGFFSSGAWGGPKIDNPSSAGRDPIDPMSEDESEALLKHYIPWLEQVGAEFIGDGSQRITVAQVVYDVVVNNRGPRQIEDDYKMGHGTVTEILKDALYRYAVIAGWAKHNEK